MANEFEIIIRLPKELENLFQMIELLTGNTIDNFIKRVLYGEFTSMLDTPEILVSYLEESIFKDIEKLKTC